MICLRSYFVQPKGALHYPKIWPVELYESREVLLTSYVNGLSLTTEVMLSNRILTRNP